MHRIKLELPKLSMWDDDAYCSLQGTYLVIFLSLAGVFSDLNNLEDTVERGR